MLEHKSLFFYLFYASFSNYFLELKFVQDHLVRTLGFEVEDLSFLRIGKFIDNGSEGGVMTCKIDNVDISLVVKMHFNYGESTNTFKSGRVEARILKNVPKHPNIIFLIHDFFSRPTDEMVNTCITDNDVRYFMKKEYDAILKKCVYRISLFLVYKSYPSNLYDWSVEKRKDCQLIDIIRICYEISCGILHLWEHDVVHRDLKLENILIDGEGHIVIIDFGLAIKLINGKAFVDRPGGNPGHLAPEVLNSKFPGEVDYSKQPSFALGVLFHEIIMGSHPFGIYPDRFNKPISVPVLDSEKMKQTNDPIIDDILIEMISKLVCSSPIDRMSLREANNILSKLYLQYSLKLLLYDSSKYLQINRDNYEK